MIIEMDVLRMLAMKVGNLHEERSVPLWQSAAVQVIQQGAVYILIPIGMIAAIAIATILITSWTYQKSGELMELKLQAQQLQRENEQLRVQISKLERRNGFIRRRRNIGNGGTITYSLRESKRSGRKGEPSIIALMRGRRTFVRRPHCYLSNKAVQCRTVQ